jgi:hypothetical protein
MYYNVGMKSVTRPKLRDIGKLASRALHRIDPRTVRIREYRRRSRLWIAIPLLGAVLVAGAATLAATGGEEETTGQAVVSTEPPSAPGTYASAATREPAAPERAASSNDERREPPPGHANFNDPFYVFTEGEVAAVSAYPLADPPGLVVNLDGAPEPTSDPESMVGDDPRVRAVRRRITDKGVRYVLGITIPIKRIDVLHEGSVVIITPVK